MTKKLMDKSFYDSWRNGLIVFLVILLLEALAYLAFFRFTTGFMEKYWMWIVYLDISVVSIGVSVVYMLSNRTRVPCMTGMMNGMTIGMQLGMMIGAVIGATNGYFTGAMVGMLLGSAGGVLAGLSSKSTMSWVQGLMSGIMGGTMGPMISVMMFTDRIALFMPFYIILNVVLIWGFMKMYYEEAIEGNNELVRKRIDLTTFTSTTIIVTTILLLIMVYGPKSPIFAFG
jgi:hypothetical protein